MKNSKEKYDIDMSIVCMKVDDLPKTFGVYFICSEVECTEKILYIGSTSNLSNRIKNTTHPYYKAKKVYKNVYIRFLEVKDFKYIENVLIFKYAPQYNRRVPRFHPDKLIKEKKNKWWLLKFNPHIKDLIKNNDSILTFVSQKINTTIIGVHTMLNSDSQTLFHIVLIEKIMQELDMTLPQLVYKNPKYYDKNGKLKN